MGQEHHRLAGFRQLFRIQLGDHDGQRYGDDHAQDDENRVVYQRVAQHRFEIAGFEQKLEILKAHPIAIVDQAPQKAPARARAVVLEGDDHAKHGRVAEDDVPNRGGEMEQKQLQIVKGRSAGPLVPSPAFSRLFWYGCRRDSVQCAHPFWPIAGWSIHLIMCMNYHGRIIPLDHISCQ